MGDWRVVSEDSSASRSLMRVMCVHVAPVIMERGEGGKEKEEGGEEREKIGKGGKEREKRREG